MILTWFSGVCFEGFCRAETAPCITRTTLLVSITMMIFVTALMVVNACESNTTT